MSNASILNDFKLYIAARDCKDGAVSQRNGHTRGIAVDTDKPALDYQAADCLERVCKASIRKALGEPYPDICVYCGSRVESCRCDILAKRGIDTKTIRIGEYGFIEYKAVNSETK